MTNKKSSKHDTQKLEKRRNDVMYTKQQLHGKPLLSKQYNTHTQSNPS